VNQGNPKRVAKSPTSRPCPNCDAPIIWMNTKYGRPMPFEPHSMLIDDVADGDGYALRSDGLVVSISEVSPRALAGMARVMMRHRCPRWAGMLAERRAAEAEAEMSLRDALPHRPPAAGS
jgi:hypothetical protein